MKTSTIVAMALIGMLTIFSAAAQNNNVGIGTTTPDASALLELESTTQGFLPPRMTGAERNAIPTPAAGLVLWCTDCGTDGQLQVYNGTSWTNMVGGAASNPITVQQRLDGVVVPAATPKQIYDSGMPLDSLYGKTYQGGLIAYLNTSDGTGLIAAASDQSIGMQWTLLAYHGTLIGASAQSTTDGSANTDAIIAQTLATAANTYAAGICRLHSAPGDGGLNDWYLPSKDELNYLWDNLADSDGNGLNNGPLDPNNLGGFANWDYWSSTEVDNGSAWFQSFYFGGGSFTIKALPINRVRAVRAF